MANPYFLFLVFLKMDILKMDKEKFSIVFECSYLSGMKYTSPPNEVGPMALLYNVNGFLNNHAYFRI